MQAGVVGPVHRQERKEVLTGAKEGIIVSTQREE